MKIYVGAWTKDQEKARNLRSILEILDHEVTATWIDRINPEAKYSSSDYAFGAERDISDLKRSEAIICITGNSSPSGGKHFETGYAMALGLKVYIYGPRENVFHYHSKVVQLLDEADLAIEFGSRNR